MRKTIFAITILTILLLSGIGNAQHSGELNIEGINNSTEKSPMLFFYRPTCGHCQQTIKWLESVKGDYENIEIMYLNIDEENEFFWEVINAYEIKEVSFPLPLIFISDQSYIGPEEVEEGLEKKNERS